MTRLGTLLHASFIGRETGWSLLAIMLGGLALVGFVLPRPVPGGIVILVSQGAALLAMRAGLRLQPATEVGAWRILTWGIAGLVVFLVPVGLGLATYATTSAFPLRAIGYGVALVGWVSMLHRGEREAAMNHCLEALTVASAAGMTGWILVVEPALERGVFSSWLDALTLIAYPSLDVAALMIVAQVAWTDRGLPWPQRLLLSAMIVNTAGDVAVLLGVTAGIQALIGFADIAVQLIVPFVAAAVVHPATRATRPAIARRKAPPRLMGAHLALLAGALLVPPVTLVLHDLAGGGHDPAPSPRGGAPSLDVEIALGAAALAMFVAGRMWLALSQLEHALRVRDQLEMDLKRQAQADALTLLPNNAAFNARLQRDLVGQPAESIAVLFCDLDDFKAVNDGLGHAVGDELLTAVAGRLRATTRPVDLAARLGGDEFAVLLSGLTEPGQADTAAQRILDAFTTPFEIGGSIIPVRLSIGVSTAIPGIDATELVRAADIAMYAAKTGGKARAVHFDDQLRAQASERDTVQADLAGAIGRGELLLDYQPIWSLDSRTLVGAEALIRWEHPTRGLLGPQQFIPQAEQSGLILAIGGWALREACRQMRLWLEAGASPHAHVAVNVSPLQLLAPGFVTDVEATLAVTGIEPGNLLLEITESAFLDAREATRILDDLKRLGVRLAVDDFGTGYSAMSYLASFPIDVLKIDRSFVTAMTRSPQGLALVTTLLQLARDLNLETIAEGIEDPEQMEALRRLGCGMGQGYLTGRPAGAASVGILLTAIPAPSRPEPAVAVAARPTPRPT